MVETAPYEVIKILESVEIRDYPHLVLATVSDPGDDSSFNLLFRYISGNNTSSTQISMTAPVISSEKIEMTAPVINRKGSMSFVLPSKYSIENAPKPKDNRVLVHLEKAKMIAVIKFSGYANEDEIEKNKMTLLRILEKNGINIKGEPIVMRYNSPWTPGFMRRNEVGIEIVN
ncbi:heme-binding protein [Candidatus Bathyarchaeota archaeon]|nr:heme-binding protein [Candidatus Bathyarchaeota archaeon]